MRPCDVQRGDVVYWGDKSSGIVQSVHGRFVNVKTNPTGQVQTLSVMKLRKTK